MAFVCEECLDPNVVSMFRSFERCEVCHKSRSCADVPIGWAKEGLIDVNSKTPLLVAKSITNLGTSCPTQWEGITEKGEHIYIRYRFGYLYVRVGDDQVFQTNYGDDMGGVMTSEKMLELTGIKILD